MGYRQQGYLIMKALVLLFLIFTASTGIARTFTEMELVEMIESSPTLKSLESQIERLDSEINGVMVNFSPTLEAAFAYNDTEEQPLIIFEPPPQPFYSADIKLNHSTVYGIGYSLGFLGESIETAPPSDPNGFQFNSARFNPTASVSMDLLRNRFGSESANQVKSLKARQRALQLEREIAKEKMTSEIRKLFWSHNILIEKRKINLSLLDLSEKLLKDIKRKKSQGFVESGDLYSAQSQTSGQKTNIALINYQIEKVKKTLSTFLPGLPIDYDLKTVEMNDQAQEIFFKCLDSVVANKETPFHLSYYSEQMNEKKMALSYTEESLQSFNLPSLRLFGEISGAHVDSRFVRATSDFLDEANFGYTVGLNFSLPLTAHLRKQQKNLIISERYQINSENEEQKAELIALHQETVRSIKLLNQALVDQRQTTTSLSKSYSFKQKQYNQARADLFDVTQEQNNYLSSQLNQLDIVQIIIEALLDYRAKFQKFTCQGVTT
jgi:outer membrane protein TolC